MFFEENNNPDSVEQIPCNSQYISKISRHIKKQENVTPPKKKPKIIDNEINTNTQILKSADKGTKIAIINMLMYV